ncbi:MAG TPA: hypothetical protein DDX71_07290 [Ruminococcus sp.]|nr:hypothetical protein [Ruminococcus sp.]
MDLAQSLENLQQAADFSIQPHTAATDFRNKDRFAKLDLTKAQLSLLSQQIMPAIAADTLASAYCVRFPQGVPHTLMQYKTGGFGTPIMGDAGIVGHASLHPLAAQAAVMGVFSVMSVATGQYFLTQINNHLDKMSQKIDKILAFLYGNKKAELISEISYIQYAQQCYSSIMQHDAQRTASIAGIQAANKVAMKDIEFYLYDLLGTVQHEKDLKVQAEKAMQIVDSLQLSIQLYVMSSILEVYYSENYDDQYLAYLESSVSEYVDKCEKRMLGSMMILQKEINDAASKKIGKGISIPQKPQVDRLVDSLQKAEESAAYSLHNALYAPKQPTEIYLTNDGEAFIEIS